jgi:hypothetical protein
VNKTFLAVATILLPLINLYPARSETREQWIELGSRILRNRRTGEGLKYTISDEWLPKIPRWNKSDPPARFDAAMAAERLFESEPVP